MTRTFGVYARLRPGIVPPSIPTTPNPVIGAPPFFVQHGQLTRGHALDRFRQGSHAVVYTVNAREGILGLTKDDVKGMRSASEPVYNTGMCSMRGSRSNSS